ncbi:hypothetical protein D3C83_243380 [compost metagenome]
MPPARATLHSVFRLPIHATLLASNFNSLLPNKGSTRVPRCTWPITEPSFGAML